LSPTASAGYVFIVIETSDRPRLLKARPCRCDRDTVTVRFFAQGRTFQRFKSKRCYRAGVSLAFDQEADARAYRDWCVDQIVADLQATICDLQDIKNDAGRLTTYAPDYEAELALGLRQLMPSHPSLAPCP
jgi:hypothetical protein